MAPVLKTIAAQTAASFTASIGVNIHPAYSGTEYANVEAWFDKLVDAGFEHVRTNWWIGDDTNDHLIERLADAGIKVLITSDWLFRQGISAKAAADYLAARPELAASIYEIAGPNEVNANFVNWQHTVPAFMKELYTAFKANPATEHIKIVAPNFDEMRNNGYPGQVGDLSKYVDEGDIHGSNGVEAPTDSYFDTVVHNAQVLSGTGKPLVNTEGGYSYGVDSSALGHPVALPEYAIEIDTMHYFLENFSHGIVQSDVYQLLNSQPNGPWGDKFGLLDDQYKPTVTYNAIKALTTLLADSGAVDTQKTSTLPFALEGADANTRTLLLEKSDGSFWLAVWEQEQVFLYNTADSLKGPVAQRSVPMTLTLDHAASGAVYMPDSGSTKAVSTFDGTEKITFTGGAKVALIELKFAEHAGDPVVTHPTPGTGDGVETPPDQPHDPPVPPVQAEPQTPPAPPQTVPHDTPKPPPQAEPHNPPTPPHTEPSGPPQPPAQAEPQAPSQPSNGHGKGHGNAHKPSLPSPTLSDADGHKTYLVPHLPNFTNKAITDFDAKFDHLNITQTLFAGGYRGHDPFKDHVLALTKMGHDTKITFDPKGIDPAHGVEVVTVENVTPHEIQSDLVWWW